MGGVGSAGFPWRRLIATIVLAIGLGVQLEYLTDWKCPVRVVDGQLQRARAARMGSVDVSPWFKPDFFVLEHDAEGEWRAVDVEPGYFYFHDGTVPGPGIFWSVDWDVEKAGFELRFASTTVTTMMSKPVGGAEADLSDEQAWELIRDYWRRERPNMEDSWGELVPNSPTTAHRVFWDGIAHAAVLGVLLLCTPVAFVWLLMGVDRWVAERRGAVVGEACLRFPYRRLRIALLLLVCLCLEVWHLAEPDSPVRVQEGIIADVREYFGSYREPDGSSSSRRFALERDEGGAWTITSVDFGYRRSAAPSIYYARAYSSEPRGFELAFSSVMTTTIVVTPDGGAEADLTTEQAWALIRDFWAQANGLERIDDLVPGQDVERVIHWDGVFHAIVLTGLLLATPVGVLAAVVGLSRWRWSSWRARRGLCRGCGYALGRADRCPECGLGVPGGDRRGSAQSNPLPSEPRRAR